MHPENPDKETQHANSLFLIQAHTYELGRISEEVKRSNRKKDVASEGCGEPRSPE